MKVTLNEISDIFFSTVYTQMDGFACFTLSIRSGRIWRNL